MDKKLNRIIDTLDKQFEMWNDGTKTKDDKLGPAEKPVGKEDANKRYLHTCVTCGRKFTSHNPSERYCSPYCYYPPYKRDEVKFGNLVDSLIDSVRVEMDENDIERVSLRLVKDIASMDETIGSSIEKEEIIHAAYKKLDAKPSNHRIQSHIKTEVAIEGNGKPYCRMAKARRVAGVVIVIAVISLIGFAGYNESARRILVEEPTFSVEVVDVNGVELDDDWFVYELYATTDTMDIGQYVLCESGTGLHGLRYAELDDPGEYGLPDSAVFICKYNGTSDTGVVYQSRWSVIQPGQRNVLLAVERPAATAFIVSYLNFTAVNTSVGVRAGDGIVITAFAGPTGAWVADFNRSPSIQVRFADPVGLAEFRMVDGADPLQKYKVDDSCLRFKLSYLGYEPVSYVGSWLESNNTIIEMSIMFGDEQLRAW